MPSTTLAPSEQIRPSHASVVSSEPSEVLHWDGNHWLPAAHAIRRRAVEVGLPYGVTAADAGVPTEKTTAPKMRTHATGRLEVICR